MDSFSSYLFRKAYARAHKTEKGGRPNVDEVVMVKLLVFQQWYGLSDPELERQANDRISFHWFLGYPDAGARLGSRA